MQKALKIFINSIPVLVMIGLIPLVRDDFMLTLFYVLIIFISLYIKHTRVEIFIFVFGLVMMTIFESIFISTGVEVFVRNSLFGLMPLWLPFIWGYGFVAIKRSIDIIV